MSDGFDARGLAPALEQSREPVVVPLRPGVGRATASREQALAELCEQQRRVIEQYALLFNMTAGAIEHVFPERAKGLRKVAETAADISRPVGQG